MAVVDRKETRLVARTSTEIQEFIQRAADYSGASVSQFLIDAALEKARDVVDRTESLNLSMSGADALYSALDNPSKANVKLRKAAKRYQEEMNVDSHRRNI